MRSAERLWTPSASRIEQAGITRFRRWLNDERGLRFDDYESLWRWSTTELEAFWEALWQFSAVIAHSPYQRVLERRGMPGARWFSGATLNYAEHLLARAQHSAARDAPAIVFQSETRPRAEISWGGLAAQVGALAATLKRLGVAPGDRVVSYLPSIPETVAALLAATSMGAVWSSCSPDMGPVGVLDRFRQIEPKILFAVDGYRYGGKPYDRRETVRELVERLPSLQAVIFVPYLDAHSHGGTVLEGKKANTLHFDIGERDRFVWFSSTGWFMWNIWVSSLATGCTALQFDGSPVHPDLRTLWRFAESERATFFGVSAAFLSMCAKAGLRPREELDLSSLRTVGSTGSPLSEESYRWVYERVHPDVMLASISGGTDPGAAFLTSCPTLPIYAGEMQCRGLGVAVHAFDDSGTPVLNEVGELVVTEPMPSMPIYFWGDEGGKRYFESYFETWPNVWRHGDWLELIPRPESVTSVIYGRSDSTINRHGIRMGTSELYRVVEQFPEVADSLVVDLEYLGRESYLALFVVLRDQTGAGIPSQLRTRLFDAIRSKLSARHVPNDVFAIGEVPRTLSGKKMEVPVKKILLGHSIEKSVNRDSMANPGSLDWFIAFARERGKGSTGSSG